MTRRRWIADRLEGDRAFLIGQHAHHLARVLRARPGQEFDIVCDAVVRLGRIASISDDEVAFDLGAELPQAATRDVTLLLSVFKFDRFEWAIEKATELGVAVIQPVVAQRTDAHLASGAAKRAERWRRIAHEAAQQSRRTAEPIIPDPINLKDALSAPSTGASPSHPGDRILLSETETQLSLAQAVAQSSGPLCLAIGPEGGWTNDELRRFADAGWTSATLGPTILRAETAAIAAMAIAVSLTRHQ